MGKRVRIAREYCGISKEALSQKLNVTRQQLKEYEAGRVCIKATTLAQIAKATKLPVSWFYEQTK